jgi:glucose-1-phosphatase
MASPIQVIFWDLGDVLVQLDYKRVVARLCQTLHIDYPQLRQGVFDSGLFRDFNCGQITSSQFHQRVLQAFQQKVSYEEFVESWCDFFTPRPAMSALLQRLQGRLPMWLLSNTDPLHHQTCQKLVPELSLLTGQITSYEVQAMKPGAAIYEEALRQAGSPPHAALFFDDRQENIDGAQQLGIQALLYRSPQQVEEDLKRLSLLP